MLLWNFKAGKLLVTAGEHRSYHVLFFRIVVQQ